MSTILRHSVLICAVLSSSLFLLGTSNEARADIVETFDDGADGWNCISYPFRTHVPDPAHHPVVHESDFGNPPGSVWTGDDYPETGISAPAPFLGDQTVYFGGFLEFDIYIRYADGVVYPAAVINAGDMSIYYDAPPTGTEFWETRKIPLKPYGWKVSDTGNDVTAAQFNHVLGNIQGLYIYTEWRTGPDSTNVDNVGLTLPDPVVIEDHFPIDYGKDGWLIVSYPLQTHVPNPSSHAATYDMTFGNPAGSLWAGDDYYATGVAAPSRYLGDQSRFYGGYLEYDIYLRFTDGEPYPAVVINAGNMSIYYDAPSPKAYTWETRSVPLVSEGWKVSDSGEEVTPEQFQYVMENIQGLYIYTEWYIGPDNTHIDNVHFQADGSMIAKKADRPPHLVTSLRNRPNPFNPATVIDLELAAPCRGSLVIHDVAGRLVETLLAGEDLPAGLLTVMWNGTDAAGRTMPSGVYYYRFESEKVGLTRSMLLVR